MAFLRPSYGLPGAFLKPSCVLRPSSVPAPFRAAFQPSCELPAAPFLRASGRGLALASARLPECAGFGSCHPSTVAGGPSSGHRTSCPAQPSVFLCTRKVRSACLPAVQRPLQKKICSYGIPPAALLRSSGPPCPFRRALFRALSGLQGKVSLPASIPASVPPTFGAPS